MTHTSFIFKRDETAHWVQARSSEGNWAAAALRECRLARSESDSLNRAAQKLRWSHF